jgi:hypothetical protein
MGIFVAIPLRNRTSASERANNETFNDPRDVGGCLHNLARHYHPCRNWKRTDRCGRDVCLEQVAGHNRSFPLHDGAHQLDCFLFPIHGFTPALGVGIVACAILALALFALYKERLVGAWRWIYVITAVVSLYLNVFVLAVQSFVKVSALNALAPMQTEPPFVVTQAVMLVIFILIALIAVIRFQPPKLDQRTWGGHEIDRFAPTTFGG